MQRCIGLIVDTETTGLTEHDEIVELALLLFSYDPMSGIIDGPIDRYLGLREPQVQCSIEALQIHRITPDLTLGKSLDKHKVMSLFEQANVVFSHNTRFDKSFLIRLFPDLPDRPWLCTMRDIIWEWEGLLQVGLDAICNYLQIAQSNAHRALEDAITILALLRRSNCDGNPHIKQLHERLHRPRYCVSFINEETGRKRKLIIADQNDEYLARGGDKMNIHLWTKSNYKFINGYLRGSISGNGRVFQFEKTKNRGLHSMLETGDRIELTLTSRSNDNIEFNIVKKWG